MSTNPESRLEGFTLFEVIMALSIFALVSVSLWNTVTSMIQVASNIRSINDKEDELNAFMSVCRSEFRRISAGTSFLAKSESNGNNIHTSVTISNSPPLFLSKNQAHQNSVTVIKDIPKSNGLRDLVVEYPNNTQVEPFSQIILEDIESITWEFSRADASAQSENWSDEFSSPVLVTVTILSPHSITPQKATFWIPPKLTVATVFPKASISDKTDKQEDRP